MESSIKAFLNSKNVAVVGMSRRADAFGNQIGINLRARGYNVVGIHPEVKEIAGVPCVATPGELPRDIENLIILVKPSSARDLVAALGSSPIRRVWLHKGAGPGSASPEAIQLLREQGREVVYGFCPMMFFDGKGIHKFHFNVRKLLGGVPKEYKAS